MNDSAEPAHIAVTTTSHSLTQQAQQLAAELGLPFVEPGSESANEQPGQHQFALALTPVPGEPVATEIYRLALQSLHSKDSDIAVDFAEGQLAHRRQYGGGRKQPLPRAVGIKPGYRPAIIDTTAGLARDAFVLACQGCHVIMFERSPVMHALIANGLMRAKHDATIGDMIANNLQLMSGDAAIQLDGINIQQKETIYLDPMYPHRNKSALVKKEMRIIRALVGDDHDTARLLQTALKQASKRVVVKRPRLAPALDGPRPTTTVESKNTRYDIYITG